MLAVFQDVRQHKRLLIFHQMQVGEGVREADLRPQRLKSELRIKTLVSR